MIVIFGNSNISFIHEYATVLVIIKCSINKEPNIKLIISGMLFRVGIMNRLPKNCWNLHNFGDIFST